MKLILRSLTICVVIILFWEAIVYVGDYPDYILPSPLQVGITLYEQCGMIFSQSITTITETIVGLLLGILCGCIAGFIIAFFRPVSMWFLPLLIMSQAIPTFAIAPILVIWLGYGLSSKIVTTVLMIFFPIASAFYDGLHKTHSGWLELAHTMNAKKWRIFFFIRIPAALPALASGIRIAAVGAPIGAIIGEWVGSSQGLGYLMLNANARMQIDVMFAALIVIIVLALILYFTVDNLLRKLIWWD